MNVGSLFAGIGGFDLGLERAGTRTAWQVEQEPFRRAVLARHFPDAKRYEDVREVGAHNLEWVDVICGGFPCQDLSLAGKGAGIDGARSGLWSEYARIVGELRPRYVIVENVPALLGRGLGRVLGDLAACGYDAEWDCLPASTFGAPHRRDRIWLVAYPGSSRRWQDARSALGDEGADEGRAAQDDHEPGGDGEGGRARSLAHAAGDGRRSRWAGRSLGEGADGKDLTATRMADSNSEQTERPSVAWGERDPWATEPGVDRVVNGLPRRMDRVAALGDALVPQIAQWIGERIIAFEESKALQDQAA